jgi:hypothetical protein
LDQIQSQEAVLVVAYLHVTLVDRLRYTAIADSLAMIYVLWNNACESSSHRDQFILTMRPSAARRILAEVVQFYSGTKARDHLHRFTNKSAASAADCYTCGLRLIQRLAFRWSPSGRTGVLDLFQCDRRHYHWSGVTQLESLR